MTWSGAIRRRTGAPLLASALLHAAGASVLVPWLRPAAEAAVRGEPADRVEVEIESEEGSSTAPTVAPAQGHLRETSAAAAVPVRTVDAHRRSAVTDAPEPEQISLLAPEPAASSWSLPVVSPQPTPIDLGAARIGLTSPDRPPPEEPPSRYAAPRGLEEEMATHDAAMNVGPVGRLAATLRRATFDHVDGQAVGILRVAFDASGRVVAVRLLHTSGPSAGWTAVAATVAGATSSSLHGATVDLRIDVTLRHGPVGQTHRTEVHGDTWATASSDDLRGARDVALTVLRIAR